MILWVIFLSSDQAGTCYELEGLGSGCCLLKELLPDGEVRLKTKQNPKLLGNGFIGEGETETDRDRDRQTDTHTETERQRQRKEKQD